MGFSLSRGIDSFTGKSQRDKANEANRARYKEATELLQALIWRNDDQKNPLMQMMQGREQLVNEGLKNTQRKATKQANQGFAQAQQQLAGQGATARRGIMQNQQRLQARSSSGLEQSGLSNTTRGSSLGRAITSDTGQQLGGLAEMIGRLQSGVSMQQGQTLSGITQNMGTQRTMGRANVQGDLINLLMALEGRHNELTQNKANVIVGREDVAGKSGMDMMNETMTAVGSLIPG